MLTSAVIMPINYALHREGWPCERLKVYMGRIFYIQIPFLIHCKTQINEKGEIQSVDDNSQADTTITLPPFALPGLLAQKAVAFEQISVTGDRTFADELINIAKQININMIIEQDLSQVIGDIAAHRIVNTSEHLLQWQTENFDRISHALVEYWTEENPFLTKHTAVNQWIQDIKNLQLNIEKLEQRLNTLTQSLS